MPKPGIPPGFCLDLVAYPWAKIIQESNILNKYQYCIFYFIFFINNMLLLTGTVDRILRDDDTNNDGYLTYTEYANARRAGKILEKAQKQKERKETIENT